MGTDLITTVLGIVIGVSFVIFVLSIVAASIQELLTAAVKWRSKDLKAGLARMLGSGLKDHVLQHPLVRAMGENPAYLPADAVTRALLDYFVPADSGPLTYARLRSTLLSYVSLPEYLRLQLTALLETLPDAETRDAVSKAIASLPRTTADLAIGFGAGGAGAPAMATRRTGWPEGRNRAVEDWVQNLALPIDIRDEVDRWRKEFESVPGDTRKAAGMLLTLMANGEAGDRLLAGVRDVTTLIKGWDGDPRKKDELAKQLDDQMSLTEIEKVIEDLPRGTLRTAALAWLNQERRAFLSTKHNIEQWVDQSMLRIGDSYKRRAQGVVWTIAAMLVLFTGADMLRMVSGFQKSENTRAAIWTVVEQLLARPEMQGESNEQVVQSVIALIDSLPDLDLVLGYGDLVTIEQDGSLKWLVPVYRSVPATSTVASASRDEEAAVVASVAALPTAGEASSTEQQVQTSQMVIDVWATVARALRKIVGLILSVAAVSIGAPFWFDVMKRVANIRSSGLPPKALGSQR